MRKGLLLAGAIFGAALIANTANAVTIRIDEEQKVVFGARGIIDAKYKGKYNVGLWDATTGNFVDYVKKDESDLIFSHRNARIYAKYRFNKFLTAGFQAELMPARGSGVEVLDSFINLALAPEFNIIAGSYKVPFERHSGLQSGWSVLFPTGPSYGKAEMYFKLGENKVKASLKHVFTNPVEHKPFRSGSRSAGLTFWGNIADGMFKYYLGVFDVVDEDKTTPNQPKTAFAVRVQFTPTMLGYKGEKGYVLKNTYVGKKDVLTIGVSYVAQPYRNKEKGYDDQTSWGVDLMWEQKFGTLVPNFQVGYVDHNNWEGAKEDDRKGWIVQGQLLYDQRVWIGKPALVVKYTRSDFEGKEWKMKVGKLSVNEPSLTTWGVGINYFIKGPSNRVSLAIDNVKVDDISAPKFDDNYTDVTLSIFYNF